MSQENPFAADYSLSKATIVSARGIKLAEPPRFAKKYGSEKSYEPLSLDLWQELIRRRDVICDIGAHHGIYSLVAARTGKAEAIYAYEPVKENVAFLKNNARLNKLAGKITVRNVALSNRVGSARFQITMASDNANIKGHPNSPTLRTAQVRMSTLDVDFEDSKLDLIKIDTDGYEPFIIDGAVSTFKKNPQLRMLIEFNPKCLRKNKYDPMEFFERLTGLGFELFLIDDINSVVSQITRRQAVWREIESTPFFYNVLCLPANDEKQIAKLKKKLTSMQASEKISDVKLDGPNSTKTWRHIIEPIRKTLRRT